MIFLIKILIDLGPWFWVLLLSIDTECYLVAQASLEFNPTVSPSWMTGFGCVPGLNLLLYSDIHSRYYIQTSTLWSSSTFLLRTMDSSVLGILPSQVLHVRPPVLLLCFWKTVLLYFWSSWQSWFLVMGCSPGLWTLASSSKRLYLPVLELHRLFNISPNSKRCQLGDLLYVSFWRPSKDHSSFLWWYFPIHQMWRHSCLRSWVSGLLWPFTYSTLGLGTWLWAQWP